MSTSQTMTGIKIAAPGGPEQLTPCTLRRPVPGPGEMLIKIAAAGLNRPDILQRKGLYPVPEGASPLPGLEVSGIVAGGETGPFAPGDKVVALVNGGGYAEYVTVPSGQVLPLPRTYDFAAGAALPETLFTVEQTLVDRAGLTAGQTVLIHGGAGGIGGVAIQRARLAGAIPYATVSSTEKATYAARLGAEATIDYKNEDFAEKIRELTDGRGIDIVLDIIGAPYLKQNLRALAQGGTLIALAVLGGPRGEIDLGLVLRKHLTLFGSTLRPRSAAEKAKIAAHLHQKVWPALESGQFAKPGLKTFPLTEAAAAHTAMDAPGHLGKIVLLTPFGMA